MANYVPKLTRNELSHCKLRAMKFGLCTSPQALGISHPIFDENIARLKDSGADYLEFGVACTAPEGSKHEFELLQTALANAALRVEAFNSFIPAHHRITGPEVHLSKVLEYSAIALKRCKLLGGDIVVLGSAGARKVPQGFDFAQAEQQFIEFCREVGPIAQSENITICLEPLNANEDNLVLSVGHGARLVDEIAHPHIQLLADLYHIELEGESLSHVATTGSRLHHTHVADKGRVAPGFSAQGEADFKGFFAALRRAEYEGRCSFEGEYNDLFEQAEPLLSLLKRRYDESNQSG